MGVFDMDAAINDQLRRYRRPTAWVVNSEAGTHYPGIVWRTDAGQEKFTYSPDPLADEDEAQNRARAYLLRAKRAHSRTLAAIQKQLLNGRR